MEVLGFLFLVLEARVARMVLFPLFEGEDGEDVESHVVGRPQ